MGSLPNPAPAVVEEPAISGTARVIMDPPTG